MQKLLFSLLLLFSFVAIACSNSPNSKQIDNRLKNMIESSSQLQKDNTTNSKNDTAIFAAGCFWCVEGQLKHLDGVLAVKSGYIGGTIANPSYEQVCTGKTGHAEAVRVIFDPQKISYDELLAAFFYAHDPTQLNRQGNDIGTQYRSAIFPLNEAQKEKANYYINKLNEEKLYTSPIVTTVEPIAPFYDAESYHDNYFERNPQNTYCQFVVKPKIEKFKKVFAEKLKNE